MATLKQVMPSATVDAPAAPPAGLSGVALLASRSIEVRAAWTATQPPFIFPYTNPAEDFDVSRHMSSMRSVEPMYNLYWHRLSFECCARGGLMLDVGSNFGCCTHAALALTYPEPEPDPNPYRVLQAFDAACASK